MCVCVLNELIIKGHSGTHVLMLIYMHIEQKNFGKYLKVGIVEDSDIHEHMYQYIHAHMY